MCVEKPAHPVYALTTYELRDYRRALEESLATYGENVEVREWLGEVVGEQEDRERSVRASRMGTVGFRTF